MPRACDELITFVQSVLSIIQVQQRFFFPIFSFKDWWDPRFCDVLNFFNVIFGFLDSLLKISNTVNHSWNTIPKPFQEQQQRMRLREFKQQQFRSFTENEKVNWVPNGGCKGFTLCFLLQTQLLPRNQVFPYTQILIWVSGKQEQLAALVSMMWWARKWIDRACDLILKLLSLKSFLPLDSLWPFLAFHSNI